MTRLSSFLFNTLLLFVFYYNVYHGGDKAGLLNYTNTYVIAPYVVLSLILAVVALLRWFFKQSPEMAKECTAFLNNAWYVAALAFFANRYVLANGDIAKMFSEMLKYFTHFIS